MFENNVLLFLFIINLIAINAKDLQNDVSTSATPSSTLQGSTSKDIHLESENLIKRDLKETDLSSANTFSVAAKSYDPPPEFYRGPGATGHLTSTQVPGYYNSNYKPNNDFKTRPVAFPDTHNDNNNYNKYNGVSGGIQDKSSIHLANSYNSWQNLKGKVGELLNKKQTLQDRISVGHYGTTEHGGSTNGGYAYEGRPYGGQAHHAEYPYYGSGVAPSAHTSGYYGGSAGTEGIPFDVYGNKNQYSGSAGTEYASYSSLSDVHEPVAHKSHPDISHKAILAKSFLIPLASAAVLGLAAALVSNPLLLQLGTVSGVGPGAAAFGKRKRRDLTTSNTLHLNSINSTDLTSSDSERNKKDSKLLPYRGHHHHHKQQK